MNQNFIGSNNWSELLPQMQFLFDQLNDAIFFVDPKGEILHLNKSASKLSGYELSEIIGKPIGAFFPGHPKFSNTVEHQTPHPQNLKSTTNSEEFPRYNTEILTKHGQKVSVEVTHIHFKNVSRNISCIILKNVSEQNISDTLREINSTLTSSLNLNEVFDLLLSELHKLIPYDGGNIMFIKEKTADITRTLGYENFGGKLSVLVNSLKFDIESTDHIKEIINSKKTVILPNTSELHYWHHNIASVNFKSWIGVPIIIENKVNAIISLDKVESNFFTEKHADILTIFANQASSAIKNARIHEEELNRIQQLDGLQSTLAAINSQLELKTLLNEIVIKSIGLLGGSNGELAMYDPATDKLNILVSHNFQKFNSHEIIEYNQSLLNKVAKTRQPIRLDRDSENPSLVGITNILGDHSGMAVPLLAGEKLLGVLAVADMETDKKFTDNDMALLNTFAQQATIAIHNSQLYEDANQRAEESETMRRVGAAVTSSLNQAQAINSILKQLELMIPYDSAAVLLLKKENLSVVGSRGFSSLDQIMGKKLPLNHKNPVTDVFLQKKSISISNMEEVYPGLAHEMGMESEIKSWLGAPLIIKERCLGILSLNSIEVDRFSQAHLRLVAAFADQVAIALENAQLYTDAARAADRFMTLYQLSQIISTNLRTEDIYPSIHQAVSELMITEFFGISLYDSNTETITDVYLIDNGQPQPLTTRPLTKGLFASVIKNQESLLYHSFDLKDAEEMGAVIIGDMSIQELSQSILVVPLKIGPRIIGVITAQSYQPSMYSKSDQETLELLAANVAIAIENAKLFDEVQKLAITDPLTHLFNRRKFEESAFKEFERSLRYHRPLCAIMIDLDHFKIVNDTYGHLAGDQVLSSLAALFKRNLRNIDILARYGGEEFIILLPETSAVEALATAERLRKDCEITKFENPQGSISIYISLGVSELNRTCKTLEELIDRADQALYESKNKGRNKSTLWASQMKNMLHHH